MKHIFLIDPIEKLTIYKDSSLFFMNYLKEKQHEVYILYTEDLSIVNKGGTYLTLYNFEGVNKDNKVDSFVVTSQIKMKLDTNCVVNMRLDPPFNEHYLKNLWVLTLFEELGIQVINSPKGILKWNEKILALKNDFSAKSCIGSNLETIEKFLKDTDSEHFIVKPLNLYQGLGVKKLKKDEVYHFFKDLKEKDFFILQPYLKEIENGEIRVTYFAGKKIGGILKSPKKGSYLANVAQGATYKEYGLDKNIERRCLEICNELLKDGISWIAFDIIGDKFSEVNITCPGLIVELALSQKNVLETLYDSYLDKITLKDQ